MGFEFGVLQKLDFKITLYCFVIVVAFVIGVEYVFGILEYYLEGSRLYTKMIHMIYKELMLMGMLTFCVMMYEAVPADKDNVIEEEWLTSIDFSHVYLFFVTFFFVSHAFYLMAMSVSAVSEYRLMFSERTASLVEGLQDLKKSCIGSSLFYLKLLPVCNTRYHVEFSMVQSLFTRLYKLPEDLDFPYYLSGCFDRVALKIINRSIFTWIVLLFIVICNYARIRYNLTGRTFKYVCGLLGVQVTDEEAGRGPTTLEDTLFIFMVCGTVLVVYTILLTLISRIYKARLVDRVYPNHSSIDDYIGVMNAKLAEQQQPNERVRALRISSADLKKEIEIEFDVVEEGEEEDEEGIKYAAQSMLAVYKYLADSIEAWHLYIRVAIHTCCCGDDRGHRGASRSLLARSTSSVGDVERSGAGAKKSVTEAKAVYVPLRRRLKFSKAQRDLLCHRMQALSERDSLNSRTTRTYGALSTSEEAGDTAAAERRPHRAEEESAGCCGNCSTLLCCTCCDSEWDDANLNSIFFASKPIWYFRAVELQVMFTCMYMALWATNFVSLVRNTEDYSLTREITYQLLMVVPILFAYYRIAYIAETYALITAICDLNIEVLYEVLVNTEDMAVLASELRAKINAKISAWAGVTEPSEEQQRTFVQLLFEEIDQDGSGAIDKGEFRMLLRKLNLNYSDHRFNLLFRALDSVGGDGSVEEQDLIEFMFPSTDSDANAGGGADGQSSSATGSPLGSAGTGTSAGGRIRQRAQSAEEAFIQASLRATREMQIERTFVATTFSSTHDRSRISRPLD